MIKKFKLLPLLFFISLSSTYANSSKSYQYDQKENLKQEASIFYEYDQFNRLTSKNYPNGRKVQFQYDSLGNCTQVIDDNKTTYYEYDIFENISKITFPNFQSIIRNNSLKSTSIFKNFPIEFVKITSKM